MVAQRTLTPYVRVRILLPLPNETTESVLLSVVFLAFAGFLMQKN